MIDTRKAIDTFQLSSIPWRPNRCILILYVNASTTTTTQSQNLALPSVDIQPYHLLPLHLHPPLRQQELQSTSEAWRARRCSTRGHAHACVTIRATNRRLRRPLKVSTPIDYASCRGLKSVTTEPIQLVDVDSPN